MSTVAVLGAGDLGGAIVHALAARGRTREILLVDEAAGVAAGKALDIQQSCPIDLVDVRVTASGDVLAAVGARVIVIADGFGTGVWDGEAGLALVARLQRAGATAPIVCAGPRHAALMELVARETGIAADRLIGTAASAVVGAARALVGLEVAGAGGDVSIAVTGRPPAFVIAWSAATIGGALVTERVPAHRLLAITTVLKTLWPAGPRAIAAASCPVIEALVSGSRRTHQAVAILDNEFGARGVAALVPLSLGDGRVLARHTPSLSPQERTDLTNSLGRR